MKAILYSATFAVLVSTPVFSADSVSLVGTWAGQRDRIAKIEGRRGGLATLVITEQQGNTFVGRLKRSNPTGDEEEPRSIKIPSTIATARLALLRDPCAQD